MASSELVRIYRLQRSSEIEPTAWFDILDVRYFDASTKTPSDELFDKQVHEKHESHRREFECGLAFSIDRSGSCMTCFESQRDRDFDVNKVRDKSLSSQPQ